MSIVTNLIIIYLEILPAKGKVSTYPHAKSACMDTYIYAYMHALDRYLTW